MDTAERALHWAAEVFDQFDRELDTADPQSVFTALADVARERLNGADAASVTTYDGKRFVTVAATHEAARQADQLQYDRHLGPCVSAASEEDPVCHVPDLHAPGPHGPGPRGPDLHDPAPHRPAPHGGGWPSDARAEVAALGFSGILSVRLSTRRVPAPRLSPPAPADAPPGSAAANSAPANTVPAETAPADTTPTDSTPTKVAVTLNLYSAKPDAFDGQAVRMAVLLAARARMALRTAQGEAHALNLERSRQTAQQIGAAVGILMTTRAIGHDEAMDLLRTTSQRANTRVRDLAAGVIATGELPRMKNRAPRPKKRNQPKRPEM